jgi:hypothetical protein
MAQANSPSENVRALQRALYVAAKRNGGRKFPASGPFRVKRGLWPISGEILTLRWVSRPECSSAAEMEAFSGALCSYLEVDLGLRRMLLHWRG